MWRRIRALFAIDEHSLELVFVANAAVAIAGGVGTFLFWDFALVYAAELTAAVFCALTACLLSRRTAMVAAVAGGLFFATFMGGIGWGFALQVHPAAGYAGVVLGAALGLGAAYPAYGAVIASHRARERQTQQRKTDFTP